MPKDGSKPSSKNSSKTARVLGLLTNSSAEEEAAAPSALEPERDAPKPPQPSDNQVVEAEVRGALEHELEDVLIEIQAQPPVETFTPFQEAHPTQEPEPVEAPASREAASGPADPPAEDDTPQEFKEAAMGPKSRLEPDIFCFNITQALVEAKADKYIDLFGLCKCDRCRIDVIALALTNLPAKYVVAHKNEMVPLLSVYEGKYNAAIVSQVMNACKMVMEHPRHAK